ncbi:OmpP1/FadL family transporter [Hymenobacter caeli]|uniref:Aromatic hydrocarbon degradation protein n=1 Tax=Hymenobacter caeli TaxID=2735894 RepID=A0ABX2FSI5_9BACT|nr:hypothetical protein [Hymenobacter caeli]NRT19324.1 hypothetical protein [Hymenobacter caeli]
MKKRIIWLSLALAMGQASHAFAQNAVDALRYSQLQFGGPARTQGIAGANVALGADFGNLTSNPAGLGFYQKSEFHGTLGLGFGQTDGVLTNGLLNSSAKLNEQSNSVNIPSIGLVLANRLPDSDRGSSWRGGSFALGFTRLADFNQTSNYQGSVPDGQSFFQRLREPQRSLPDISGQFYHGNSDGSYNNLDGLAYGGYLTQIVKNPQKTDSTLQTTPRTGAIGQGERVVSTGSMSQLDFGYGGSFRDRLYIGVGLGIVLSDYRESRDFVETPNNPNQDFASLQLHDELHTTGTGVNGRLGLIFRATNALRFGASVQTPTYMHLTDTYGTSLTTSFTQPSGTFFNTIAPGVYDYTLTTPFRANTGVSLVLGKYGFISGDVEYVGYGQARLNSDPNSQNGDNYSFSAENQSIQALYHNTLNYRVGAEGRYSVFRARLGYAYYGDPYAVPSGGRSSANSYYTAGLGLRQGNFFLDVAEVYNAYKTAYSPYYLNGGQQPVVALNSSRYTTSLTAGVTF